MERTCPILTHPFRWFAKATLLGAILGYLVNLSAAGRMAGGLRSAGIVELEPDPGGTGELTLQGGARVPVARERMAELRARLGGG